MTASRSYFPEAVELAVAPYLPMFGPLTPTPNATLADLVFDGASFVPGAVVAPVRKPHRGADRGIIRPVAA